MFEKDANPPVTFARCESIRLRKATGTGSFKARVTCPKLRSNDMSTMARDSAEYVLLAALTTSTFLSACQA
jgi:hypothetical protein